MSAEKGSAFLLKVGDGGTPPVFATVAGMRTTQMSVNGEAVNVTSKDSEGWLTLAEPPPFAPAAGDLVEIREGCDKILATCTGRFGNVANFRGEPHLPGIDLLTRYPGA